MLPWVTQLIILPVENPSVRIWYRFISEIGKCTGCVGSPVHNIIHGWYGSACLYVVNDSYCLLVYDCGFVKTVKRTVENALCRQVALLRPYACILCVCTCILHSTMTPRRELCSNVTVWITSYTRVSLT